MISRSRDNYPSDELKRAEAVEGKDRNENQKVVKSKASTVVASLAGAAHSSESGAR